MILSLFFAILSGVGVDELMQSSGVVAESSLVRILRSVWVSLGSPWDRQWRWFKTSLLGAVFISFGPLVEVRLTLEP